MAKRKRLAAAAKRPLDGRIELRLNEHEKATYEEVANRQGISLSHWFRLAARTVIKTTGGKVELVRLDD